MEILDEDLANKDLPEEIESTEEAKESNQQVAEASASSEPTEVVERASSQMSAESDPSPKAAIEFEDDAVEVPQFELPPVN